MGATAYLLFKNWYYQVTWQRMFWYALIRQVCPNVVSCWLHCICCKFIYITYH